MWEIAEIFEWAEFFLNIFRQPNDQNFPLLLTMKRFSPPDKTMTTPVRRPTTFMKNGTRRRSDSNKHTPTASINGSDCTCKDD